MTFLNNTMLIALTAVAVPILIHLLRRGRAKAVDWGAMRFLLASLALRNRRIMLEEFVVLAVRCLLLALLALAVARPFLPSGAAVPWQVVLPAVLLAALCLAMGAAMWSKRLKRWAFFAAAAVLLAVAGLSTVWERHQQAKRWSASSGQQDIAIVIDASMSMGLRVAGERNFNRAVREARDVVASARRGDAVSVFLAGPVPRGVVPSLTSDHREVFKALESLNRPGGGPVGVLGALNAAVASLAGGNNLAKWIVLITDGQNVGWDLRNKERWDYLAAALRGLPGSPRIVIRSLGLPRRFRNAAVENVTLSRQVVGSDREVKIDVKVLNAGAAALGSFQVVLSIDGRDLPALSVGDLRQNAAETLRFGHRFSRPGPHVITARADCPDDLVGDNSISRVVHVVDRLPVLIVDGAPSTEPLGGAATFIEIALAPRGPVEGHRRSIASDVDRVQFLAEPTVVPAPDIAAVADFSAYRLIVLANVPKLPAGAAGRVADFVRAGGGLLIAPGDHARRGFYNHWKGPAGRLVSPALLVSRKDLGETPLRLSPRTFNHPALELVAEPSYSRDAMIKAYWRLGPDEKDLSVRVAARLANGEPFIVERKMGKGYVLLTAISLDRHDSNLQTLKPFFVPLVHEMAYYLASPLVVNANLAPGVEVALTVPLSPDRLAPGRRGRQRAITVGDTLVVATPSAEQGQAEIVDLSPKHLRARFAGTDEPGLYRLILPAELAGGLAESVRTSEAARGGWPFVVEGDPQESRLVALKADELALAGRHGVDLFLAQTPDELTAVIRGGMPGDELWRTLALAALVAMVAEIFLTRWIAVQRQSLAAQAVRFGEHDVSLADESPPAGPPAEGAEQPDAVTVESS